MQQTAQQRRRRKRMKKKTEAINGTPDAADGHACGIFGMNESASFIYYYHNFFFAVATFLYLSLFFPDPVI